MSLTYHTTDIRNVALAGHGASGKTSLADALLFAGGVTTRKGSVDDGTSALDVDDEEKRRLKSVVATVSVENELLREKIARLENGRPLAFWKSKP